MYFDTLKVSTVDQATSQVTARGGRGNPEQIGWDYGKEITVTLEDALYTPASQSLMWGAKFGTKKTKIRGFWNPYLYDGYFKIRQNTIYYPKNYIENNYGDFEPLVEDYEDVPSVLCECHNAVDSESSGQVVEEKYVPYEYLRSIHRVLNEEEKPYYYKTITAPSGHYKYYYNKGGLVPYPKTELTDVENYLQTANGEGVYCYTSAAALSKENWMSEKRPEIAEITLSNYGDFSFETEDGIRDYRNFTQNIDNGFNNLSRFIAYKWEDVEIKMASLEGNRDIYYMDHCTMRFQVRNNFSNKLVSFATPYYRPTVFDEETGTWIEDTEAESYIEYPRDRVLNEGESWQRLSSNFYPEIDFYTVSKEKGIDGFFINVYKKIGTFYIILDWNADNEVGQESIHPIEKGFSQVRYVDRMQKCVAPKRFAINTDNNLLLSNYRYLQKYKYSELTVYIDPRTMKPYTPNNSFYTTAEGKELCGQFKVFKEGEIYYKWERVKSPPNISIGNSLIIDAEHYPGTYRLVGETYCKNRVGENMHYQFEIPLAKMSTESKLTLQADGEPTIFTFKLKALRRNDGTMMKITEYKTDCNYYGDNISGSNKVVPLDSIEDPQIEQKYDYNAKARMELLYPHEEDMYDVSIDDPEKEITPIVGLVTTGTTKITTYNKNTLQDISEEYISKETSEILTPGEDYTITIKNNRTEASE